MTTSLSAPASLTRADEATHLHQLVSGLLTSISVDTADCEGTTLLLWASANGHLDIVQLVVSKGANPNLRDMFGNTALHNACYNGHLDVVQFLASNGSDLEARDNNGVRPLHAACEEGYLEIAKVLIDLHNVDVNALSYDGRTPTRICTMKGHHAVMHFLRSRGGNANFTQNSPSITNWSFFLST